MGTRRGNTILGINPGLQGLCGAIVLRKAAGSWTQDVEGT